MYLELCYKLAIMRVSRFNSVQMLYMKPLSDIEENDNGEDENDSNRSNNNNDKDKNSASS